MFGQCQRIDPTRCTREKFGLAVGRPKPSVDEYAEACAAIVQSLAVDVDPRVATGTPTDQLRNMYISGGPEGSTRIMPVLASEGDYLRALEHCLAASLDAIASSSDSSMACRNLSWLACVHPPLLQYCAKLPADSIESIKTRLRDVAGKWMTVSAAIGKINSVQVDELKRQSETIVDFITASWPEPLPTSDLVASVDTKESENGHVGLRQTTIAESLLHCTNKLDLDLSKAPLATVQLSYCYLAGLRLLEQELYKEAQMWFARGLKTLEASSSSVESQQQPLSAVAQQGAEKDRVLKLALTAQVEVHGKLASLLYRIEQGANVNDLSEDIDAILETQVPIRFEFLEHLVLICLRQDQKSVFTRLVGTIATNQKLYQQLPEIHITLLQIASLLVVVRDVLVEAGIDIACELGKTKADADSPSSFKLLSGEALTRLQTSVSDIAVLLLKIPIDAKSTAAVSIRATIGCTMQVGSRVENEIERFCRMWDDPTYLLLLGALLSEILQRSSGKSVRGPLAVCELAAHIVDKHRDASDDIAIDGGEEGSVEDTALPSIVQDAFNSESEEGQQNIRHMRDIAFIVFACAARQSPDSACLWLYFSAVASGGGHMTSQFLALFIEYLSLQTNGFAPKLIDACICTTWFQEWLPGMIRSLTDLRMSGAAAVLHQCKTTTDIDYEAAILLLVRAFERNEISQRAAECFWDPNIIEYGQYLAKQPSASALRIEFPVPSAELTASKSLILSSYFLWMSSVFSAK
ncbi:hypothetical protein IWW38_003018 [Coemansia aciculifera]|uniref:Uncharacterized protein n=1 Tax=Coemansia aciculifera TaxID=417176 RepID=A0ACC1M2M7_9FUNG|nr:hypothetical protein IWW38_003018 [Coemansia aciculifera]